MVISIYVPYWDLDDSHVDLIITDVASMFEENEEVFPLKKSENPR